MNTKSSSKYLPEIASFTFLFVLLILGFSPYRAESPEWREKVGLGTIVAACSSSSPSNPSCQGNKGSVTLTWDQADHDCIKAILQINLASSGAIVDRIDNLQCSQSYLWSNGSCGTTYNYTVEFYNPGGYFEATQGTFTTPSPQTKQCEDTADNDGDTLVDLADPGCSDATDNNENSPGNPQGFACTDSTQCATGLVCNGGTCGLPACAVSFSPSTVTSSGTTTLSGPTCGSSATYSCTGSIGSGTLSPGNTLEANPTQTQTCTITGSGQGQATITINPGPVQNFKEVPPR